MRSCRIGAAGPAVRCARAMAGRPGPRFVRGRSGQRTARDRRGHDTGVSPSGRLLPWSSVRPPLEGQRALDPDSGSRVRTVSNPSISNGPVSKSTVLNSTGLEDADLPPEIDTTRAHPARIYDYFLGGKDNFAADRETAARALEVWPSVQVSRQGKPGFPRPRRPLPDGGGGHRPVPRHRLRAPERHQRARGGPGRQPGGTRRVRGQRPDRAGARAGAAGQLTGRQVRLHPRGPARSGKDPERPGDAGHPGLQPADRPAHRGGAALHPRQGRTAADRLDPGGRAAVGQLRGLLARHGRVHGGRADR